MLNHSLRTLILGHPKPCGKVLALGHLVSPLNQAVLKGDNNYSLGYFNHRSLTSGLFSDLDLSKHGEHPSFDSMTPAEKELTFDWVAAMTSELPMYIYMLQVLKDQTRKALFDEQAVKEVLPHLDVVYISCTRTHWSLAWGAVELRRQIKEEAQQGRKVRTICFKDIPGENHFVSCSVVTSVGEQY